MTIETTVKIIDDDGNIVESRKVMEAAIPVIDAFGEKSLLAPGAFQFSSGFSSGDLRVSMLYITCMTNIGTRCK